jgi:predicted acetyltransferase
MRVEAIRADAGDQEVIGRLMQLYVHDFSELWPGEADGELQDDGRFAHYPLEPYWSEPDRIPLLLRADGRLAGFALVNAHAHSGRPVERNMAEFFVVRKHRRAGVGTVGARLIFSRYPGLWETAVARRNAAALPFWRKAITGHPQAQDIEQTDVESARWNGPIFRFRIREPV